MNSKKGVAVAIIVLVAVIALAAVAYNVLAANRPAIQVDSSAAKEQADKLVESKTDASSASSSAAQGSAGSLDMDVLDFTVFDQSGNQVKLSSMKGKPTVLSFWATWCPPCMKETGEVQALYDKLGGDVNIMMVNVTDGSRETQEGVTTWYEENQIGYPIYFDTTLEAASMFQVQVLPSTFVFDSQGNLVEAFQGSLNAEDMEQRLAQLS